jgi:hypothetical protein
MQIDDSFTGKGTSSTLQYPDCAARLSQRYLHRHVRITLRSGGSVSISSPSAAGGRRRGAFVSVGGTVGGGSQEHDYLHPTCGVGPVQLEVQY